MRAAIDALACVILQVQSLLLQLAKDPSQDVVDAAFEQLLPAVLTWTVGTDLLHTSLLPIILNDIRASVDRYALLPCVNGQHVLLLCMLDNATHLTSTWKHPNDL